MISRNVRLFVFYLLVFSVSFFSLSVVSATADVAYIISKNSDKDNYLLDELRGLGYTYDIINESYLPSVNLSRYRFLVVGDSNFVYPERVPVGNYKMIVINSRYYYVKSASNPQWGLSQYGGLVTSNRQTNLRIVDRNSDITKEVSDIFVSYNTAMIPTYYLEGRKASGLNSLVSTMQADGSEVVVANLERGAQLLPVNGGKQVKERMVFFGIVRTQYWTSETRKLFANSIKWILFGEDSDGDGYYSDIDCNDRDASVHPDADEVPYDGIDQDCDGVDLIDVDGDGFCKAGLIIQNSLLQCFEERGLFGTDCDDYDFEVNLFNFEPEYNCRNDAPIVEEIEDIYVKENETVEIVIDAYDPEGDTLFYSINSSKFLQVGNRFIWKTGYDDEGSYVFVISVSDGSLVTNVSVNVEVDGENRPPVALNIPEIVWDEDASVEVNLSKYFVDLDGDQLFFGIENTSDGDNIFLMSQEKEVFNFSSAPDFYGTAWIVFWASDGKERVVSNLVVLRVNPVNDAPVLITEIPNLTLQEDSSNEGFLDLSDYFMDVDSEVSYRFINVSENIQVKIENGLVSFYPRINFIGEETMRIVAFDENYEVESNDFLIKVVEANDSPEIFLLNCTTEILEDVSESCLLEASDEENDSLVFSVLSSRGLICSLNGSVLSYVSQKDYYGNAFCEIGVSDSYNLVRKVFNVRILPVNDPPVINFSYPSDILIRIIAGRSNTFSIVAYDVDSNLRINWLVNGESKFNVRGSRSNYTFSGDVGNYLLEALISDGEFSARRSWTVFVSPFSDFSCAEIGGKICSEKQVCSVDSVRVKDGSMCCLGECNLAFTAARACANKTDEFIVRIKKPVSNAKFEVGEKVIPEVEIENKDVGRLRGKIEAFIYDATRDRIITKDFFSFDFDEKKEIFMLEGLEIPEDLDLSHEYYLYIKGVSAEECFHEYRKIGIERPKNKVLIRDFEAPREVNCGDSFEVKVGVENIGSEEQNVYIYVQNEKLKLYQKSELFELEEFGEKDREVRKFVINLPQKLSEGSYSIKAGVVAGSNSDVLEKNIYLSCVSENESLGVLDTQQTRTAIHLKDVRKNTLKDGREYYPSVLLLIAWNFILISLCTIVYLTILKRKRNGKVRSFKIGRVSKRK